MFGSPGSWSPRRRVRVYKRGDDDDDEIAYFSVGAGKTRQELIMEMRYPNVT